MTTPLLTCFTYMKNDNFICTKFKLFTDIHEHIHVSKIHKNTYSTLIHTRGLINSSSIHFYCITMWD